MDGKRRLRFWACPRRTPDALWLHWSKIAIPELGTSDGSNESRARRGHDLNFHAPEKCLTCFNALTGDDEILKAFRFVGSPTRWTRLRPRRRRGPKKGGDENRVTGNFAWAEFVPLHRAAVSAAFPNPHLHVHCFAFKRDLDATESRWKAANFRDIKADAPI